MKVPTNAGGDEARAMHLKQIRATGMRDWLDESCWIAKQPDLTTDSDDIDVFLHIRWFVFASDRGPDQKKCDRLIAGDLSNSLSSRSSCA
eukprot:2644656-Pyramimonas_sp.AAC.1